MRMVVINADDFGITSAISKGILEGCHSGALTSVSAVVTTPSWDEALDRVKKAGVDVGIHLTLNAGKPLSRALFSSSLVENGLSFWKTPGKTPRMYLANDKKHRCLIYDEFKLQIERLISKGITPTHLDSHFHIHVFPAIAGIVLELGREFRIRYVRVPVDKRVAVNLRHPTRGLISCLATMSLAGKTRALPFYGLHEAGRLTLDIADKIFRRINVSASELMVHPGRDCSENAEYYAVPPSHCEKELDVVTNPTMRGLLNRYDLKPVRRDEIPSQYYI